MKRLVIFDKTQQQKQNSNEEEEDGLEDMTMEIFIEKHVLPSALKCNIDIEKFWDYTLKDIRLLMEAHREVEKEKLHYQAQMDYVQSSVLANFIGSMLSKGATPIAFEEAYNFLFTAQELAEIEMAKQRAEEEKRIKELSLGWSLFAEQFNAKYRNGNKEKGSGD